MGNSSSDKAIAWFDTNASLLKSNYNEGLKGSFVKIICDHLSAAPLDILDLGAGTGVVSQHLADLGHRVIAVEPSAAMRTLATPANYTLLDDRWPDLTKTHTLKRSFDAVIEIAMRMFVDEADCAAGFTNTVAMLKPGGYYYAGVKHSAADIDRGAYLVTEAEVLALAAANGLRVIYNEIQPDLQGRKNVLWRGYIFQLPTRS